MKKNNPSKNSEGLTLTKQVRNHYYKEISKLREKFRRRLK